MDELDAVRGSFWRSVSGEQIVERVVARAHALKISTVHADQREALMLQSAFARHGLGYEVHDWTSASKPKAIETLRRLFADGRIHLPEHDDLRSELMNFEERITPSGAITFAARGAGHDDFVSLLITACMADLPVGRRHSAEFESSLEAMLDRPRWSGRGFG
ncbi:MAG TPA: hypothetical protein VGM56_32125 [Byssovorax sp.]